jgi:hypothetical protein
MKMMMNRSGNDMYEKGSVPLISMKVAIPSRKVTMATLDAISQRSLDVTFSSSVKR